MKKEKKTKEKQEIPIPLIEKPSIRIDVDISLRDIDFYVASRVKHVAPQLAIDWGVYDDNDDITWIHPYDMDPSLLQNLREEHLKVEGVPPELTRLSPDSKLSLIYYIKKISKCKNWTNSRTKF